MWSIPTPSLADPRFLSSPLDFRGRWVVAGKTVRAFIELWKSVPFFFLSFSSSIFFFDPRALDYALSSRASLSLTGLLIPRLTFAKLYGEPRKNWLSPTKQLRSNKREIPSSTLTFPPFLFLFIHAYISTKRSTRIPRILGRQVIRLSRKVYKLKGWERVKFQASRITNVVEEKKKFSILY